MGNKMKYIEVEHKFNVGKTFDREGLFNKIKMLNPINHFSTVVVDHYFTTERVPHCIYRWRKDPLIEQLTVKEFGGLESEIRFEVNLNVSVSSLDEVEAFLSPLGILEKKKINKHVWVFEFSDCEVVYYQAKCNRQAFYCVEIEATKVASQNQALHLIRKYEEDLDLETFPREKKSLYQMFFS